MDPCLSHSISNSYQLIQQIIALIHDLFSVSTLPETNVFAPENRPSLPKRNRKLVFQPPRSWPTELISVDLACQRALLAASHEIRQNQKLSPETLGWGWE